MLSLIDVTGEKCVLSGSVESKAEKNEQSNSLSFAELDSL
jgi:hypothetical protein